MTQREICRGPQIAKWIVLSHPGCTTQWIQCSPRDPPLILSRIACGVVLGGTALKDRPSGKATDQGTGRVVLTLVECWEDPKPPSALSQGVQVDGPKALSGVDFALSPPQPQISPPSVETGFTCWQVPPHQGQRARPEYNDPGRTLHTQEKEPSAQSSSAPCGPAECQE